jgi:hypothetical protein
MAGSSPTGFRDLATGFLSGFAALATADAGVLGVLHETGYIGSHTAVAPVVVATSANDESSGASRICKRCFQFDCSGDARCCIRCSAEADFGDAGASPAEGASIGLAGLCSSRNCTERCSRSCFAARNSARGINKLGRVTYHAEWRMDRFWPRLLPYDHASWRQVRSGEFRADHRHLHQRRTWDHQWEEHTTSSE